MARVRKGGGVYCSRSCHADAQRGRPSPRAGQRDPAKWVTRQCLFCHQAFDVRKIYTERSAMSGRTCSPRCRDLLRAGGSPIEDRTIPCEVCGKAFTVRPSAKGSARKRCSVECRRERRKHECETCGRTFERQKSLRPRFCSRRCYRRSSKPNRFEMAAARELASCGVGFTAEAPLGSRMTLDFLLDGHGIAIEVQAPYWHEKTRERDRRKSAKAKKAGIMVIWVETDRKDLVRPLVRSALHRYLPGGLGLRLLTG